METFPLHRDDGTEYAFEIPSSYFVTARQLAKFFSRWPTVEIQNVYRLFDFGNEVRIEFRFQGDEYQVWEPYGDNSRYWVGPKDDSIPALSSISALREHVENDWPGPISKARAKLLSLFSRRTHT